MKNCNNARTRFLIAAVSSFHSCIVSLATYNLTVVVPFVLMSKKIFYFAGRIEPGRLTLPLHCLCFIVLGGHTGPPLRVHTSLLYQHLIAVYNVNARLGNLAEFATLEVIDSFNLSVFTFHLLNVCCVTTVTERQSCRICSTCR